MPLETVVNRNEVGANWDRHTNEKTAFRKLHKKYVGRTPHNEGNWPPRSRVHSEVDKDDAQLALTYRGISNENNAHQ